LSVGWSFGESGTLPPLVGMWTPNVVMGGVGIFLLSRMDRK
jgi:lipopolysaccharide export system permease protein